MIAIGAHGIVKSFGGRRILDGLELEIDERARIGIIGANGSGKSTLLRILAGLEDADAGEVSRRKDAVVAYLPQQVPGDEPGPASPDSQRSRLLLSSATRTSLSSAAPPSPRSCRSGC